jgi:methylthioribose-1-phosphate isomerase
VASVSWDGGAVRLLDQTKLPTEESYIACRSAHDVAAAIKQMVVRGAPAIGAAAGYGVALAARDGKLDEGVKAIKASRPTARDLFYAVERVERAAGRGGFDAALAEAHAIAQENVDACRKMGRLGVELLSANPRIVTICNTGALATVDYGTAFGVIRAAHERDLRPFVFVMETRPRAQGARLTTWELQKLGIPHRLIADSAIGRLLQTGGADVALAGSDRICANGDVVNKVGTYPLALLCREHGVPFYAVAPLSTVDFATASGDEVEVEERAESEVTDFAPPGTHAWNPAFDVTPATLVSAIVTERGVLRPPYPESIARLHD